MAREAKPGFPQYTLQPGEAHINRFNDGLILQIAYRGYWQRVLLSCLQKNTSLSVKDLVELTGIRQQDVHEVLEKLGILKYWRGEHVMSPQGKLIDDILESLDKKKSIGIDVSRLHWTPFSSVQQVLPVS